jgi:hypothetical protein
VFGRRHAKNRRELVRAEFSQSLDHFRQAAAHAAGGVGASVGPSVGSAKSKVSNARGLVGPTAGKAKDAAGHGWESTIAAFVPLAEAAKEGAAKAAKLPPYKKDAPKTKVKAETSSDSNVSGAMFTLLAAGAAIGATGALVARRRNRTRWADYEPESVKTDADLLIDSTKAKLASTADDDHPDVAHKVATWAKEHVDTLRHKIHEATADHPESLKSTANDLTGKARDGKEKISDSASHLQDKTEAKLNDASARRSTMSKASDEVDDLLRSTHNGRM